MELRVHSGNEVTDYETHFGEWKIQLTMQIIFISSIDSRETCIMRVKSDNIEIMMVSKTKDIIKELKNLFYKIIRKDQKNRWEKAGLFLIGLIYCIIVVRKRV